MRKPGIVLIELDGGWNLHAAAVGGPSQFVASHDTKTLVENVQSFSVEHGCDTSKVLLSIATQSVFFVRLPAEVCGRIRNDFSLRYALEAYLPVDAEQIVADFVRIPAKANRIARAVVALEIEHIRLLIEGLEEANCQVQHIAPTTLLALEQLQRAKRVQSPCVIVLRDYQTDGQLESMAEVLVLAADGSISDWHVAEFSTQSIQTALQMAKATDMPLFYLSPQGLASQSSPQDFDAFATETLDLRPTASDFLRDTVLQTAVAIFRDSNHRPLADLRKNELAAAAPLRHQWPAILRLSIACLVFVASLCGALCWQAIRFQATAASAMEQHETLYRRAFPNQRIPQAILGRLRSEQAKIVGLKTSQLFEAFPSSSLPTLGLVLHSFQSEYPYEVEEIRIDGTRVAMEVKLRSPQDAGRLAAEIAKQGFRVAPPSTALIEGDNIRATILADVQPVGPPPGAQP